MNAAVDLGGGYPIEVPRMTSNEAYQLLRSILPEISTTDASVLSSRLDHLPLALVQAASFIKKESITVRNYIDRLDEGDSKFVDLLSEPFQIEGRDSRAPHAVTATCIISFEEIERTDKVASDILSFLGVLHFQAIPKTLIEHYYQELYPNENENSNPSSLLEALDLLRSFSLISEGKGQDIDMHRMVQLVIQKWLIAKKQMAECARSAMIFLSKQFQTKLFPTEDFVTLLRYLPHANSVIGNAESYLDNDDLYTACTSLLRQIISCLWGNGYYPKILRELAEKLLNMTRIRYGDMHPTTLEQITQLAAVHHRQGRLKEAEVLSKQAYQSQHGLLGGWHRSTLGSIYLLGIIYLDQGRFEEAEDLISYAFERRRPVLGELHIDTLESMRALSKVYRHQNRIEEAEKLELRTLEFRNAVLGDQHPYTLMSLHDRANMYCSEGKFKIAKDLVQRILKEQRGILRAHHPHIISTMMLLARIRKQMGKIDEAIDLMESCLSATEAELGQDHTNTVDILSTLEQWRKEVETSAPESQHQTSSRSNLQNRQMKRWRARHRNIGRETKRKRERELAWKGNTRYM